MSQQRRTIMLNLRNLTLLMVLLPGMFVISCQQQNEGQHSSVDTPSAPIATGYLSDRSRNGVPISKTMEDAQPIGRDAPTHANDSLTIVDEKTPVDVLRTSGSFAFVKVTSGSKAGTEGWVYKNQIVDANGYAAKL
jgi:hypothetical protein